MKLKKVHFQLTGRCNLSCSFCGQARGVLACDSGNELLLADWLRIASELEAGTQITLWGGEPLLWPEFDILAKELFDHGFSLSVITNGTLIDRHVETLNRYFAEIFVSIDGDEPEHDSIRGQGVFGKLKKNIPMLANRCGKLIFMSVILDEKSVELPYGLAFFEPDEWIFSQLIYLLPEEYADYQRLAPAPYPELSKWIQGDDKDYLLRLQRIEEQLRENMPAYPMPVYITPHDYPNGRFSRRRCPAMDKRLHIRHDGETTFCTDFFGFTLGNVKNNNIQDIFFGSKAEKIRKLLNKNLLPTCRHCPWLGQSL